VASLLSARLQWQGIRPKEADFYKAILIASFAIKKTYVQSE